MQLRRFFRKVTKLQYAEGGGNNGDVRMTGRTWKELNNLLCDCGAEGSVMLDGYEDAAIGITTDNAVVYSYGDMIEVFCREGMTTEEAADWISYNTLRAIPYISDGQKPVVITTFEEMGLE